MKKLITTTLLIATSWAGLSAQSIAVKTNLLYGAAAFAPNLGVEIGLGRKSTLDLWGAYNPWNLEGTVENNKKLVHMMIQPEYRYWTCEKFNGHFIGIHGLYSMYNVNENQIPLLFDKEFRYEGVAYGGGISYGYHKMLSKRLGIEFTVGVGGAFMKYDKYNCTKCSDKLGVFQKTYVGPTRAGVTLLYIIK